ncbi:MAG: hypothetical protein CMK59_10625 [Proteobacteria bacterium]|nr:hypothetical protein [Pseudomonadota bacterium]
MPSEKTSQHPASNIVNEWRSSLKLLVDRYEAYRPREKYFAIRLFIFFIALNVLCYWLGILTAFPYLMIQKPVEYLLLQIPVGLLGASFDSLSFFITVWIAKNAINSHQTWKFLIHLSLDLVIAFLATMWVVLVFIISGWALSFFLGTPEVLGERSGIYQDRLTQALLNPLSNLRNIYFGAIMGISAGLPSFMHLYMFVHSMIKQLKAKLTRLFSQNSSSTSFDSNAPLEKPHPLLSNSKYWLKLSSSFFLICLLCLYYMWTFPSKSKLRWTNCISKPEVCAEQELLFEYSQLQNTSTDYYEITHAGDPARIFYEGAAPKSKQLSIIAQHIQKRDFKEIRREEHKRRIWKFYAGIVTIFISFIYGIQVWRGKWLIY